MSLGAALKLVGAKGKRRVLIEDFFTGAGQNILDHEILSEITVPLPEGQYSTAFTKLTRNSADLAKVNCAAKITVSGGVIDDIRIVLGAVADRPVRAKRVEIALKGREIKDEVIDEAARKVVEDITPITDARSKAEYRAQVSQVLTKRAIMRALDMAN
jgi:CO/xanthine dehydrogenase FAD-binding subunit